MQIQPPMMCVLCGSLGIFSSEEHIVPHSLGNDLVVLAPGWVCDSCNNICSSFESRALSGSILGLERCRLGVVSKKRKPSRSSLYGVTLFAEPSANPNVISAEADWAKVPIIWREDGTGAMAIPIHDKTNTDIARLLLKMGIELLAVRAAVQRRECDYLAAKDFVLGNETLPWPYFILRDQKIFQKLTSVFNVEPDAREYIKSLGFDLYLHEVGDCQIFLFQYGEFLAAVSLSSRSIKWIPVFKEWGVSYVGCPHDFAHLHG